MTANLIADCRDEPRDCLPAVVYQPVNRLKLDPGNPRKHNKKHIGQIARSIKEFGFNVPIIIDADLQVIAGHGRLLAARQLGLSEVPTICLERLTPEQLSQIYVTGSQNKMVPLSTFASLRTTTEPRELKKFQQLNAVRIQGVVPPGVPLDKALRLLEDEAQKILPQGFGVDYAGESRQLRVEGSKFLGTFLLSGILIYLVLAAQFESFRDPFIILAGSVPLAISGALTFSFLGLTTLNIYSQVGLITLVGLVSKNGILIVEFANHLQETGKEKLEAIIEAASTRLRPILMTTAATVIGHFPLVLAKGPGAGARNSIGIMLVSGMIIGTIFTLFVVPSIYMLVAKRHTAEVRDSDMDVDLSEPVESVA